MALLTVQELSRTGASIVTYAATTAVGGDTFQNSGDETVHFKNGASESLKTVTVVGTIPCSMGFLHDQVFTVPASGGERFITRLDPNRFGNTVQMTFSAATGLTVAVVRG